MLYIFIWRLISVPLAESKLKIVQTTLRLEKRVLFRMQQEAIDSVIYTPDGVWITHIVRNVLWIFFLSSSNLHANV